MKSQKLIPHLLAQLVKVNLRSSYLWHRIKSILLSNQFAKVGGRIFWSKDCVIIGHSHIHFLGNFVALARNRIEAITEHQDMNYTPCIIFGHNVSMEYDCHIGAVNHIEIGNNVLIASRVYISDHSHGSATAADLAMPPNQRPVVSKGPVIIEDDVWLGEAVAVMPNVRIGRSSIIGANSVVTCDIPPRSVAVGVPARVIRTLD